MVTHNFCADTEQIKSDCNQIVAQILLHVDYVLSADVYWERVCKFCHGTLDCASERDVDELVVLGQPMCCEKAIALFQEVSHDR